jgi:hypothetical protein
MKRALADAVQASSSLKKTADIIQQWQNLLIEPLGKSSGSTGEPIVVVIDALDESGGVETRRDLLRILAGKHQDPDVPKITDLPNNLRFIVTSRPLGDINDKFHGVQHIRQMSMDDIPPPPPSYNLTRWSSCTVSLVPHARALSPLSARRRVSHMS